MLSNAAYSESLKITEEAFLRQEFGIKTIYVKSIENFLKVSDEFYSKKIIIVSSNPVFWIPVLSKFKKDSVIFILIGNETYNPTVFNSLNNLKSLMHVFVYNLPTSIKIKNIFGSIIGNVYDGGLNKSSLPGNVYREGRISYSLQNKFKKIKINYSCSNFPQGYSNNFANQIINRIGIREDESLLSSKSKKLIVDIRESIHNFAFIGQPTNRRRELFLRNFENIPKTIILYNKEFKGTYEDPDPTYLNQLLSARYILVPPGLFNNSNHRYTESLICHTLPVILSNNSLDPSTNDNWTNQLSFLRRYSVKSQVKYLKNIDDETFEKYYNAASFNDTKKILDTKDLIKSLAGSGDES